MATGIATVAAMLALLAAPQNLKLGLTGNIDDKPDTEIVVYRGRGGTDGETAEDNDYIWNTVTVYKKLARAEAPYTDMTINGDFMFARTVRGFQWYGPPVDRMKICNVTRDDIPEVLIVYSDHKSGKVLRFDPVAQQYKLLELRVVPDGK